MKILGAFLCIISIIAMLFLSRLPDMDKERKKRRVLVVLNKAAGAVKLVKDYCGEDWVTVCIPEEAMRCVANGVYYGLVVTNLPTLVVWVRDHRPAWKVIYIENDQEGMTDPGWQAQVKAHRVLPACFRPQEFKACLTWACSHW